MNTQTAINTPLISLSPAAVVRRELGISNMTQWRWVRDGLLPQPIKIRGRNFFRTAELNEAIEKLAA